MKANATEVSPLPPAPAAPTWLLGTAEAQQAVTTGGSLLADSRVGVISGDQFTLLPLPGAASTPSLSGTW